MHYAINVAEGFLATALVTILLPILVVILIKTLPNAKEIKEAWNDFTEHYIKIDQLLVGALSGKYVQLWVLIACAVEGIGIVGVQAKDQTINVLSLICVGTLPVLIVLHLLTRHDQIRKILDDAAVKLFLTIMTICVGWYAHASATSLVTSVMKADSSRFSSAVAATTFFGVISLISIIVALAALAFLLIGTSLFWFAPTASSNTPKKLSRKFKEMFPRFLPVLFFIITMTAVAPENILGGSSTTTVIAARIAFNYDLSGPEACKTDESSKHDRFLISMDNPDYAVRYSASDLPTVPLSFLTLVQRKEALPVRLGTVVCQRQ
jgi:hypothetical protein